MKEREEREGRKERGMKEGRREVGGKERRREEGEREQRERRVRGIISRSCSYFFVLCSKPLVSVHHMEAHALTPRIDCE